jgi:iron complex outermembrane receptor protein
VVDPESYETGRASTFQDLLGFALGVFVQPRFGSDEARLSIRGSGIQRTICGRGVQVLLDGVPVNLADGGFDFQAIEPIGLKYNRGLPRQQCAAVRRHHPGRLDQLRVADRP